MANLLENKERRVVPNWRSFNKTVQLGELNSFRSKERFIHNTFSINEYILGFNNNPTIIHAADLLSAAISNAEMQYSEVEEAAKLILYNSEKATKSQIALANRVLEKEQKSNIESNFNNIFELNSSILLDPIPLYDNIRTLKNRIRFYPNNSILYVELSRNYSILGDQDSAIKAMKIALHLAPTNRFVLRCATRLFVHYHSQNNDLLDYVHYYLRNNSMTAIDPWLASAEISIATIRGRNSRYIKKGIELINSGNIHPSSYTELASGIGTVELLNGSLKKGRQFFEKSLISPNDNSLAQIEWASSKDNRLEISQEAYDVNFNYEAIAVDAYHNENFNKAIINAAKWFTDQPYSKRPIVFASNLASTILKDQKTSIQFINAGLVSHPYDPVLINNLAYALALDNRPRDAAEELEKVRYQSAISETTKICLKATRGLILFRTGREQKGRDLYLEAIRESKKINNTTLNWIAILNYAREEINCNSEYINEAMAVVNSIPASPSNLEVKILKEEVLQLYKKFQHGKKHAKSTQDEK